MTDFELQCHCQVNIWDNSRDEKAQLNKCDWITGYINKQQKLAQRALGGFPVPQKVSVVQKMPPDITE